MKHYTPCILLSLVIIPKISLY